MHIKDTSFFKFAKL